MKNVFDLAGRVAVITGGAGLLGRKHAEAIASQGGIPVLVDLEVSQPDQKALEISRTFGVDAMGCSANITELREVERVMDAVLDGATAVLTSSSTTRQTTRKWREPPRWHGPGWRIFL